MRWRHVGTVLFALVMSTGCPSEFGRDGRINKAVRQDAQGLILDDCPEEIFQKFCGDGRENTPECIEECG